ncbi:unnamed protein product, partial [marine sediment metagenome]
MCNFLFSNFDGKKMVSNVGHWRSLAEGVIPTPIACSLDLSAANLCPNDCYFCNVKKTQSGQHMSENIFRHVLDVFSKNKVKSCCVAGGGESLANPNCEDYFKRIVGIGTDIGIITNGRIYRQLPSECKFINIS